VQKLSGARWPVGWRCVVIALLFAALAGLAYETSKPEGAGTAVSKPVQSIITTITKPAVAIPLASLIVVLLASLLRRLRFEWLVYKPGPICVREVAVAPGVPDIDVDRLSTLFRGRLMQLRLHAPTPVPGATPAEDFLSVLDSEHLDATNVLGSIVSLLRAAIPTHGYEVSVTLTQQDAPPPGKPCLGVTAQLTRLPNEGVPIETVWAYSWDDAIVQAADMVTAAILPRTRLSNRAPWSGWRRYQMPGLAVHGYERAQELISARRYDEALSHCFRALQLDPKSVDLRLCKGFIEEKLGLYMDAVATYASARRVADMTAPRLYNRRARHNRKASGRIARYRLAVLLSGMKFAHQWRKPESGTRRDAQRLLLRKRLNPELQTLLEHYRVLPRDPTSERSRILTLLKPPPHNAAQERDRIVTLLQESGEPGVDDDVDPRYYELRAVLAQLAAKELRGLQRSLNWHRTQPGSLTPLSVKLTAASVRLRSCYITYTQARLESGNARNGTSLRDWASRPKLATDRSRRSFRTWTEEYSAASLYALPLLVTPDTCRADLSEEEAQREERHRTDLENAAVRHLKRAMSSTPSSHAAERRDWVLSEDPDLDGLRESLAFKHFEAIFFPSPAPTPRRPRRASRWESSRYTNALLAETAHRWESVWHQRRDLVVSRIDPHVVIEWSKDEARAWEVVARMARDYRHWPARCELIDEMGTWSARYGFDPLNVAMPRFVCDTAMADDSKEEYVRLCKAVKRTVKDNQARLDTLRARLAPITGNDDVGAEKSDVPKSHTNGHRRRSWVPASLRPGEPPLKQFERLQDELSDRDFWHRAAPNQFLQGVCDVHAAMWQRLHEWLEAPEDHELAADTDFTCAIVQAAQLSETSGVRWVGAVIARRIQRLGSTDMATQAHATNGASAGYVQPPPGLDGVSL
jgi:hypothetical protein